tara:strand:- start:36 stop:218 length:183 start_codon:yes stop_codon:yes gene_type:complete
MEAQAVALIIGSIGGLIASIIYSLKHIRESECCGSKCKQDTECNEYHTHEPHSIQNSTQV